MKALQLILILAIIGSCFTDDTEAEECGTKFQEILRNKCAAIGSCTLNDEDNGCYQTKQCADVNGASCSSNIPPKFHEEKCVLNNGACVSTRKLCADYNIYGGSSTTSIDGDVCSDLIPPTNQGNRCEYFYSTPPICSPHFDVCTGINDETQCNNNFPKDPLYKCEWKSSETTKCQPVKIQCNSYTRIPNKNICPDLQVSGASETERGKKKCIYTSARCVEKYKLCADYSDYTCNGEMPLNSAGTDYDYSKRCFYDATKETKCQTLNRYCSEYNTVIPYLLPSDEICEQLIAKDTNKRCIYKGGICQEEYKTCELYNSKEIDKSETVCEGIILEDTNKKCIYIPKEDKCETRTKYETCESYPGNDKEICESILSPTTNFYCILDKDSTCKERPSLCKYATNKKDCIYYAKASVDNKRCAYDDYGSTHTPKCYEEYARCEDYQDNDEDDCEDIKLYNGNSCIFKDNRCQSKNKICSDALTEEECKLINVTGVTDPDRMVCDFVQYYGESNKHCVENYKYCSDYRGSDGDFCSKIKPYDETGNSLDKYFKCKIVDNNVGCEKVPVDCEDAGSNAILCAEYSTKIKDSSVKYCAFYGGTCKTQFKTCEGVDNFSRDSTRCTGNIIENYITNECKVDPSDSSKCIRRNSCSSFSVSSYAELCESINTNCSYANGICYKTTKSCSGIKFYPGNEGSEEICNSIEVTKPFMICSLKEDKSGCEEKYREQRYSTVGYKEPENNSSGFIAKRIHLIMILICLLF